MTREEEFINLSWEILEHRCRYYVFDNASISDFEYDMLERKYKEMAEELGKEPTATNMVGFDQDRQSCKLVYEVLKKTTLSKKKEVLLPQPKKERKTKKKTSDV